MLEESQLSYNKLIFSSIWRRFFALLLDSLILSIPVWSANRLIPYLGGPVLGFFYGPFLEASELKGTIGKHLMGIEVLSERGSKLTLKAAIIRYVGKLLSSMFFCLGHVVAFFTPKKQAFHDLLAGSVVVVGTSEVSIAQAWFDEIKSGVRSLGRNCEKMRDPITRIEKLKTLWDSGALTKEEFESEKKKILKGS